MAAPTSPTPPGSFASILDATEVMVNNGEDVAKAYNNISTNGPTNQTCANGKKAFENFNRAVTYLEGRNRQDTQAGLRSSEDGNRTATAFSAVRGMVGEVAEKVNIMCSPEMNGPE